MEFVNESAGPGMAGIIQQYPLLAKAVGNLAETLMRQGPLPQKECEQIAVFTSAENECSFCHDSHEATFNSIEGEIHPDRSRAFALIARDVAAAEGFYSTTLEAITDAGLTTEETAHAVAVSSAFCFFNRLVTTLNPKEATAEQYKEIGVLLSTRGYL